jgi:uncharacterized protein YcbX
MTTLARITIYPVKSLPGVNVRQTVIGPGGGLCHDREYALVDAHGDFINGKRHADIHRLDAACTFKNGDTAISIRSNFRVRTFVLGDCAAYSTDRAALEAHLTDFFGTQVHIERNAAGGFPDDLDSPGPTVISTSTLNEVAGWYPGHDAHDMRRRFRANLEFDECPAFWEDCLFGAPESVVNFRIGESEFSGVNPCRRCVVPTRDPATGEELAGFQRTFTARRKETLPAWANRAQFDFFYRLAVNTRVAKSEAGKTIRVGDSVEII